MPADGPVLRFRRSFGDHDHIGPASARRCTAPTAVAWFLTNAGTLQALFELTTPVNEKDW